ncbi:hypothetical protein [uncultured Sphaerotilus sp.]|uniref:hypothetical protein n=1 Tax=uncultured Sphaerotilus sp. TaxID=474984 RepID=UPI0030CA3CF5
MNADEMPLNKTITVAQTEIFRATATRISSEIAELIYYDQSTNDETLKFHARIDGESSALVSFDKVYWSFEINGRPATEADMQDITRKVGLSIEVNAASRKISVKTN